MDKIRAILAMAGFIAALALGSGLAEQAEADAPVDAFSTTPTSTQAGGHGDLRVRIELTPSTKRPDVSCKCNVAKDITINTPAGVIGIPTNLPTCTAAQFAIEECPVESQIGMSTVFLQFFQSVVALYNMEPRSGQAGLIAIQTPTQGARPIYTSFTARTESDYGLEAKTLAIPRVVDPEVINYIFWGVPGDDRHDTMRFPRPPESFFTFGNPKQYVCAGPEDLVVGQILADVNPLESTCPNFTVPELPVTPYNLEVFPFLTFPTSCADLGGSSIETLAYDRETFLSESGFPRMTGCELISFNPSQSIQPTTTEADSPSGAEFVLHIPQPFSPEAPTPSSLREANVTLPEGFTVAPNLANGKTACTDEQAKFGTRVQAECPEASKIGLISVDVPALPGPLNGAAWIGEPKGGDRYRMIFTFDGFGLHVKLPGSLILDEDTGQIRIRFANLPQAPFERFTAHIFGAERGPLATPEQCGTYEVKSVFTPWAEALPDQTSRQFFTIDSGPDGSPCPDGERPFSPELDAGVTDNTGGEHTEFVLDLNREDGEQNLADLEVRTPPGFSGVLAGIPYCSEADLGELERDGALGVSQLSSPACSASRLGSSVATVGAGSRTLSLDGTVYLAGPYKGAPLSLAVVTPAVAGPYDLGNVVVRAALQVDPTTAQITTDTDPLPQVIDGIPLRLRRVLVHLDREGFALNPTNCSPFSVDADVEGAEGANASISTHFQVANCGSLDFAPKLGLRLRGQSGRNGHPSLQAVLRVIGDEQANIGRAAVTLPRTTLLDQSNIRTICTRAQFAEDRCPRGSIYGRAAAVSPLLDEALRGVVYLRSSDNPLPDLVMDLKGQVDVEVVGEIDSVRGGLRTIFPAIPDVPVSKFVLRLQGGARKGLIANSRDLCRNPARARSVMRGQNGRRQVTRPVLRARCGKARKRAQARKRRAGVSLARKAG